VHQRHSVFLVELTRILAIFSLFIPKLHKLMPAYTIKNTARLTDSCLTSVLYQVRALAYNQISVNTQVIRKK